MTTFIIVTTLYVLYCVLIVLLIKGKNVSKGDKKLLKIILFLISVLYFVGLIKVIQYYL